MTEMMSDAEIVAEFKQRGSWGLYMNVDLKDCDPASIRDPEKIRRFIIELCDLIDMQEIRRTADHPLRPEREGRGVLHDPAHRDVARLRPLRKRDQRRLP